MTRRQTKQTVSLAAAVLISLFVYFLLPEGEKGQHINSMGAVASLMAILWITEALPLAVTSLFPVVLFPVLGIDSGDKTAESYINSTIFLYLGGFMIALAMERWNLHRRIALTIISIVGSRPSGLILGFMLATAFLSMWMSNTATAVMMLPIGLSIISKHEELTGSKEAKKFALPLLLGIAYAASIGGTATLIGTPPNISFTRILTIIFPDAPEVNFGNWFLLAFPIALILLIFTWLILTRLVYKVERTTSTGKSEIKEELASLGPASREEKLVGTVFLITAALWMTRANLNLGMFVLPGWSGLFPKSVFLNDGTVAIFAALLLFVMPSRENESRLLGGEVFKKVPWDIILLFGGGFALAKGFVISGLSTHIGNQLSSIGGLHPLLITFMIAIAISMLTELTSNTATTEMVLPILAAFSVAAGINPLLLMITGTLSASMAFMLPAATPPNSVIFGSGRVTIPEMARTGIFLNLFASVLITIFVYFLGIIIFDIDLTAQPRWAVIKN